MNYLLVKKGLILILVLNITNFSFSQQHQGQFKVYPIVAAGLGVLIWQSSPNGTKNNFNSMNRINNVSANPKYKLQHGTIIGANGDSLKGPLLVYANKKGIRYVSVKVNNQSSIKFKEKEIKKITLSGKESNVVISKSLKTEIININGELFRVVIDGKIKLYDNHLKVNEYGKLPANYKMMVGFGDEKIKTLESVRDISNYFNNENYSKGIANVLRNSGNSIAILYDYVQFVNEIEESKSVKNWFYIEAELKNGEKILTQGLPLQWYKNKSLNISLDPALMTIENGLPQIYLKDEINRFVLEGRLYSYYHDDNTDDSFYGFKTTQEGVDYIITPSMGDELDFFTNKSNNALKSLKVFKIISSSEFELLGKGKSKKVLEYLEAPSVRGL